MEGTAEIPTQYRLRVKQRLAVVEYVRQHGIKPASRQFGLARPAVREWWRNWQRAGVQGLVPQYPARRRRRISEDVVALITQARLEHEFGASRTQIWLRRVHQVRVATETIQRVFRDIGVPHLVKTRRRRPKQLKLFEKEHPGDSVQVDVKVVARGRSKWFQYTAIDDCTRMRVRHRCALLVGVPLQLRALLDGPAGPHADGEAGRDAAVVVMARAPDTVQ